MLLHPHTPHARHRTYSTSSGPTWIPKAENNTHIKSLTVPSWAERKLAAVRAKQWRRRQIRRMEKTTTKLNEGSDKEKKIKTQQKLSEIPEQLRSRTIALYAVGGWRFRFLFYFFGRPLTSRFSFWQRLIAYRKTVEMSKGWRSYMSSNMRLSHPIQMRKTHSSSNQQCGGNSKQNYTTMTGTAAAATAMVKST